MKSLRWAGLALLIALAPGATPAAAEHGVRMRDLTGDISTRGAERIELRLPPGTIRVEPSPDGRLRVDLGVYCNLGRDDCGERAETLSLRSNLEGNTLELRVEGFNSIRNLGLNVRGKILVPRGKALEVNFSAGELTVSGIEGDLNVDAGVGEVTVILHERDVRSVRVGVGIGEANLSVAGRRIEGSGWLGQKVRWGDGAGDARVAVTLGVGDLAVKLD
ncbi:MAG TPA: hypothetical protein VJY35_13975 [Candidatus Eisenbacteria bacterium]|nr:hypothetical protein [Candidatus Eisenbacteria bacterium]